MGYRLLGFVVWKGARFYVRRNFPWLRPVASGGVVAAVLGAGALRARSRPRNAG